MGAEAEVLLGREKRKGGDPVKSAIGGPRAFGRCVVCVRGPLSERGADD